MRDLLAIVSLALMVASTPAPAPALAGFPLGGGSFSDFLTNPTELFSTGTTLIASILGGGSGGHDPTYTTASNVVSDNPALQSFSGGDDSNVVSDNPALQSTSGGDNIEQPTEQNLTAPAGFSPPAQDVVAASPSTSVTADDAPAAAPTTFSSPATDVVDAASNSTNVEDFPAAAAPATVNNVDDAPVDSASPSTSVQDLPAHAAPTTLNNVQEAPVDSASPSMSVQDSPAHAAPTTSHVKATHARPAKDVNFYHHKSHKHHKHGSRKKHVKSNHYHYGVTSAKHRKPKVKPMRIRPTFWKHRTVVEVPEKYKKMAAENKKASLNSNNMTSTAGGAAGAMNKGQATAATAACPNPQVRREWRNLSTADRANYIAATKCLSTRSTRINRFRGTSLYDDYAAVHIYGAYATQAIHLTASFLPWHRFFVQQRTLDLQACGYTGPIPYWDWTLDADNLNVQRSPVFAADSLGGAGPFNGNFVNYPLRIVDGGGGPRARNHRLERDFNFGGGSSMMAANYNSTVMARIAAIPDYFNFLMSLEQVPHDTVHYVTGGDGDMDSMASPNDPLFWLVHANVDRVWTNWQQSHPQAVQYAGPRRTRNTNVWDSSTNDVMTLYGLATNGDVRVSSLLDTQNGYLCYVYDR